MQRNETEPNVCVGEHSRTAHSRTVSSVCVQWAVKILKKRIWNLIRNLCHETPTKTNKVDSPPSRDAVAKRAHVFRTETKKKAVHKHGEPAEGQMWPVAIRKKKAYEKLWCVGNETTPKVCCDLLLSSAWP